MHVLFRGVQINVGYIDSGIIPKFASCSWGINWFKTKNQWQGAGYTPKSGDLIFIDWDIDGSCDHVGIVEKVENNKVYTIEGNYGDCCAKASYDLSSQNIFGYATPAYK